MKTIFDQENYKELTVTRARHVYGDGRGLFLKMARYIAVHPTLISQVLKGNKHFSSEQAAQLCCFLTFSANEADYYLALLEYEKAGNQNLKKMWRRRISELQKQSRSVESRLPKSKQLNESEVVRFYSSWIYSAVRLATTIPHLNSSIHIAEYLNLEHSQVHQVVQFLTQKGLIENQGHNLKAGPTSTHLPNEHVMSGRHHANWRLKAMTRQQINVDHEMTFTAPMSISKKDLRTVKSILLNAVEQISQIVDRTEPEELAYLNIDWLKVRT